MNQGTYAAALEQAKNDLLERLQQRGHLDEEIARLKQSIRLLGGLAGTDPVDIDRWLSIDGIPITQIGFTEAIRRAFNTGETFTPAQLRDFLLNCGVGVQQVNLLASVHTVLRRLEDANEIEKVGDRDFSNTFAKKGYTK